MSPKTCLSLLVALSLGCASVRNYDVLGTVEAADYVTVGGSQFIVLTVSWYDAGVHNWATGTFPFGSREYILFRNIGSCVRIYTIGRRHITLTPCRARDEFGRKRRSG
ncbi:MAG: hypothetical protein ACREA9_19770 [Pyrinomonadaceae bacterium]